MAVGGCGALLWFGSIDRFYLPDRASRITDVRGWGLERPDIDLPLRFYNMMSGGAQYQWISARKVFFFRDLKPIQVITTPPSGVNPIAISWPVSVGTPATYDIDA